MGEWAPWVVPLSKVELRTRCNVERHQRVGLLSGRADVLLALLGAPCGLRTRCGYSEDNVAELSAAFSSTCEREER